MTSKKMPLSPIAEYPEGICQNCQLFLKGSAKIVGGVACCPAICAFSCLTGTIYATYQLFKVNGGGPCYEEEIQERSTICRGCGIITSFHISQLLCMDGMIDIKQSIHVLQEMQR